MFPKALQRPPKTPSFPRDLKDLKSPMFSHNLQEQDHMTPKVILMLRTPKVLLMLRTPKSCQGTYKSTQWTQNSCPNSVQEINKKTETANIYGNFAPATAFPCTKMTFRGFLLLLSFLIQWTKHSQIRSVFDLIQEKSEIPRLYVCYFSFGSRFRIWNLRKIQPLLKNWDQIQNTL